MREDKQGVREDKQGGKKNEKLTNNISLTKCIWGRGYLRGARGCVR